MSVASRKPCPWHAAALEFGKTHNSFIAIDPRSNPKAWAAWRDYFRWMNWAPYWFCEVERQHDIAKGENTTSNHTWTAPIDHPDKFTISFQPSKTRLPPYFPLADR